MNVTEFGKKPQKYFRFQKAEYIYIYITNMMSIETNAEIWKVTLNCNMDPVGKSLEFWISVIQIQIYMSIIALNVSGQNMSIIKDYNYRLDFKKIINLIICYT